MTTAQRFQVLPRLPVEATPPKRDGALHPVLTDVDLLLHSPLRGPQEFPFGANVASLLIFDMDAEHTVAAVEVLVPQSAWKLTNDRWKVPPAVRDGSLNVPGETAEIYVEDVTPSFSFNAERGELMVRLERFTETTAWLRLSRSCYALLNGKFLAGLAVRL